LLSTLSGYRQETVDALSDSEVGAKLREAMGIKEEGLQIMQNMYPGEQILLVNDFLNQDPSRGLEMAVKALPQYEQVQMVSDFLRSASDLDRSLTTSMLSISSPESLSAGLNFLNYQPGFENYANSWAEFFQDFPSTACQASPDLSVNS
jgi:hypothetical protein